MEIRHPKTGAIGAKTPQGDIVYGPLAEDILRKQSGGTRDVMLGAGEPASIMNLGREQSTEVGNSAYQKFGLALMDILKQSQSMGTAQFKDAEMAGIDAMTGRVLEETPQDLIGASPGLQAGVRGAHAGAMQPQIAGAQKLGQTFSEQLRSFGDSLSQAGAIGEWMQNIESNEKKEMMNMLQTYPSALKNLTSEEKIAYEKKLGLPKGFIDQMPAQEEQVERFLDLGNKILAVDKQGNEIKSYPKFKTTSSSDSDDDSPMGGGITEIWNKVAKGGGTVVDGARSAKEAGYSEGEIRAFLSLNTKLTSDDRDVVMKEIFKEEDEKFLNKDWFLTNYPKETLEDLAKEGGFTTGGFLGMRTTGDVDAYINSILKTIELYRKAGSTDQEILKELLKG